MAGLGPIPIFQPSALLLPIESGTATFAVSAATSGMFFVFRAPTSAPLLTRCAIQIWSITGNAPTFVVGLEGVNTGTGQPDGTIKGGASPASVEITPVVGDTGAKIKELTFANSYQTTAGELLALTIRPKAGTTIDASNLCTFGYAGATSYQASVFPYAVNQTSGTPTKQTRTPKFAVGDANTWWGGGITGTALTSYSADQSTRVGVKFTVPAGIADYLVCEGVWIAGSATDRVVQLYDSGDTLLADVTIPTQVLGSSGSSIIGYHYWDSAAVQLVCGQTYRIVQYGPSAGMSTYYLDFSSAGILDVYGWRTGCWTQGAPGSWSDTTTRMPYMGPLISGIAELSAAALTDPPA